VNASKATFSHFATSIRTWQGASFANAKHVVFTMTALQTQTTLQGAIDFGKIASLFMAIVLLQLVHPTTPADFRRTAHFAFKQLVPEPAVQRCLQNVTTAKWARFPTFLGSFCTRKAYVPSTAFCHMWVS